VDQWQAPAQWETAKCKRLLSQVRQIRLPRIDLVKQTTTSAKTTTDQHSNEPQTSTISMGKQMGKTRNRDLSPNSKKFSTSSNYSNRRMTLKRCSRLKMTREMHKMLKASVSNCRHSKTCYKIPLKGHRTLKRWDTCSK